MADAYGDLLCAAILGAGVVTRYSIETFFIFDGETEEDIRISFDYIKGFAGDMTDPPHGDEIDIMSIHRLAHPTEELDPAEWNAVVEDERIREKCIIHAREEIIDYMASMAEARNDARQDR